MPASVPTEPDPTDPTRIRTRADLAEALRLVRERSGLSIRDVAKAIDQAPSTVGGYYSGRYAPPVTALPRILARTGITDPNLVAQWREALIRVRRLRGPRPAHSPAPYRGLASYRPEDAEWFFGRETLTDLALDRLAARHRAGDGMLVLVGPSGAGKSSLLLAGLVPAVLSGRLAATRAQEWALVLLTPTAEPLRELRDQLEQTPAAPAGGRLIAVDQFEQLFLATGEAEQAAFIAALSELAGPAGDAVVLALRADFYGAALAHPTLARAMQEGQVVVGPMSEGELRRAIIEPAHRARVDIDDGLVELLLRDIAAPAGGGTRAAHEAGALPLLSHSLLATWERSGTHRLTIEAYREIGGVHGAVARSAERVYAGLSEADQAVAQRLLLRLVRVSPDGPDTRRRVSYADLIHSRDESESEALARVLDAFIDSRMTTTDAETVEISHEAVLSAWPRLRDWLDADRSHLLIGQQVTEAAQAWAAEQSDPALLYRGSRLSAAREWLEAGHGGELTDLARDYLDLSVRKERRSVRLLYLTLAVLASLFLLATGGAVVAVQQRQVALEQEHLATDERNRALSRLVATRADRIRDRDTSLAMQLSLAAYQISPTPEARAALLDSSATHAGTRLLGSTGVMEAVAVRPDGAALAAGTADRSVLLWDLADRTHPVRTATIADAAGDVVYGIAFSPDGTLLAAGSGDQRVHLWDVRDLDAPVELGALTGPTSTVYSVVFSRDGRRVVAGSFDSRVYRWDITDASHPVALGSLAGADGAVHALAVSPSGERLAAASADQTVRLWDVRNPSRPTLLGALAGPTGKVVSVAFSPDGSTLAAGSTDSRAYLWNIIDAEHPRAVGMPLVAPSGWVSSVMFSPDGESLATVGPNSVSVWDWRAGEVTARLPHPQPVTSVVYVDEATIATAAADGTARLWSLPGPVLPGDDVTINNVRFSADGTTLGVAAGDTRLWSTTTRTLLGPPITNAADSSTALAFTPDGATLIVSDNVGGLHVWDVRDPSQVVRRLPPVPAHSMLIEQIALSPDGTLLATAADDNGVQLWDVSDVDDIRKLHDLVGFTKLVYSVVFSPDGALLAGASVDNTVRIWDVRDPARPVEVAGPLTSSQTYALSVAFSPDGQTLAVGSADKAIYLWDLADPTQPQRLGQPLVGPTNYVYALAFSPDGTTLAAANTDGTLWLWDVTDRARASVLATLTAGEQALYTVAFHPDGSTIAAGGTARTVWLWQTHPERVAEHVCAVAGDPITEAEWHQFVPTLPYAPPCRFG